jgi:agmatine deiminase
MGKICAAGLLVGAMAVSAYSSDSLDGPQRGDSPPVMKSAAEFDLSFPAEWEVHDAVWLAWPMHAHETTLPSAPVYLKIIKTLTEVVKVKILTATKSAREEITAALIQQQVPLDKVELIDGIDYTEAWVRDFGPIFLRNTAGTELGMAIFTQNTWGYQSRSEPEAKLLSAVSGTIAQRLGLPCVKTSIVGEGGNRSFNGAGVMIGGEAVERQRNPDMSLEEIEGQLKRVLGVQKVLWVNEGPVNDQLPFRGRVPGSDGKASAFALGTGGHVDEFVTFVDEHTILLAEVTEEVARQNRVSRTNRQRFEDAYQRLSVATDVAGKPFTIIRIPEAPLLYQVFRPGDYVYESLQDLHYEDGTVFPAGEPIEVMVASSYNNFLVTNGLILAQSYYQQGMAESIRAQDQQAMSILAKAYPAHRVVPIQTLPVNSRGGGIHCITQQEPRLNSKN